MITVEIDETTRGGKRIIKTIQENQNCVNIKDNSVFVIPRDENGNIIGRTLKEFEEVFCQKLSERTGYDIKPIL
jgi:hypothetical protein